jgi:uncharacterized protein YjgD (DUF1641 family)
MKIVAALSNPEMKRLMGTTITLLRMSSLLGFIEDKLHTVPMPIES